ncbi:MAG: trypsin-like peptidase domain-containing protein, partial [Myxococcales bacterium]|nr:trypsin-like peptidase domain-containing protein [Myxococcales bacterium]
MIILAPACWEEQQPPRHLGKPAPLPDQPLTLPPPSEDPPLAEAPDPTLVPDAAPKAAPAPVPALSDGAGIEDERNTIAVFQTAAPATVFVTQSQLVRNRFTLRVDEIPAGTGSGFIWDDQGHVVTNFHVVAGGDHFSITLWDGRTVPATLVGGDPQRDIAVLALQLPAEEAGKLTSVTLPPAPSGLMVGQKTLAIGNPFGLDHTL